MAAGNEATNTLGQKLAEWFDNNNHVPTNSYVPTNIPDAAGNRPAYYGHIHNEYCPVNCKKAKHVHNEYCPHKCDK